MTILAVRSLTEVLVSLATNTFLAVLIYGIILHFLLTWIVCSFRLLKLLLLWFFSKKGDDLKLKGDETLWMIWSVVTFQIACVLMKLELDYLEEFLAMGITTFIFISLIKPKLIKSK